MNLKPQDLVVALKLVLVGDAKWTYVQLAYELVISASEINAGVKRLLKARLLTPSANRGGQPRVNRKALEEFLVHGAKYAFPAERGELTRGLPTASAAPPLREQLWTAGEPPPVWPDPEGPERGFSFTPLYPTVPQAAFADGRLYELLVLVDAIRDGRARDVALAVKELKARLKR